MSVTQVQLGDVCREIYRYPTYYDIKYLEAGIPEVRGELIKEDGTLDVEPQNWRFISPQTSSKFPRTVLAEGDLVMSVRGTIGKIGLVSRDFDGANITANLLRISPDKSQVSERYLWRFMRSPEFMAALDNIASSTTIKTIKAPDLKALRVPLPPLAEQQRIAGILDQAEALRAKRHHALAQLDTLTQSLFLDLFGHPIQNEKRWPIGELGSVARVERGKFTPRPRNDPTYYDGPFPFIQTGDISSSAGRLKLWSQTLNEKGIAVSRSFPPGTVVIAIVGATLGITAILDVEVYCPDSVIGIQVHPGKAVLIRYYFDYVVARI